MRRALIATLLVCGGYYAGGAIGMGMRLVPGGPSEIWLPQGILLAALLTAPVRRWWLYAVALLPTHVQLTADFNPHVPASMMFVQFAGQFVQAAVAAALLRPILGSPPRLDSLRRMGAFIFGGTFLVPFVVQAVVVGVYFAGGFVHDFWAPWQQRVLARMSGSVIVAAPILYFAANGLAGIRRRPRRVAELVLLTACLIAAMPLLFAWKPGHPPHQWLVIVPLPFLLWSAVRFGPGALGLHLLVVVLVAVVCTKAGRGPFATGSVAEIIVALQGFFLFISIPLMLLAALVWQHAQAAASLRRSQEQYRSVVEGQSDLICRFLPDGTYTFVNDAYCRYFQRSAGRAARPEVLAIPARVPAPDLGGVPGRDHARAPRRVDRAARGRPGGRGALDRVDRARVLRRAGPRRRAPGRRPRHHRPQACRGGDQAERGAGAAFRAARPGGRRDVRPRHALPHLQSPLADRLQARRSGPGRPQSLRGVPRDPPALEGGAPSLSGGRGGGKRRRLVRQVRRIHRTRRAGRSDRGGTRATRSAASSCSPR